MENLIVRDNPVEGLRERGDSNLLAAAYHVVGAGSSAHTSNRAYEAGIFDPISDWEKAGWPELREPTTFSSIAKLLLKRFGMDRAHVWETMVAYHQDFAYRKTSSVNGDRIEFILSRCADWTSNWKSGVGKGPFPRARSRKDAAHTAGLGSR